MKIIGLAGASGSGKSTFAGLAAGILSGLGYRVLVDSFAAPIKWICREQGWDGVMTPEWRRKMQDLCIEARETKDWFTRYADRFEESSRIAHLDMVRLERIARDWNVDKFLDGQSLCPWPSFHQR